MTLNLKKGRVFSFEMESCSNGNGDVSTFEPGRTGMKQRYIRVVNVQYDVMKYCRLRGTVTSSAFQHHSHPRFPQFIATY